MRTLHDAKLAKSIRDKRYREKHKEAYSLRRKIRRELNLEKERERSRNYHRAHKKERSIYYANWRKLNKNKINTDRQNRKATDPKFKIGCALRTRLWQAIKQKTKKGSSVRDLGCSIPNLLSYLEGLFQPGMTWENYGEWHIDHIKPLASFNLGIREEFLKACHYTNLQPLWAADNISKGAR